MRSRPVVAAVLAIWMATLAGALLARAGASVVTGSVPHDALPERLSTVVELLAHNAPVAVWPLALVAIGWPTLPVARWLGDALISAQLLGHGVVVGSQLGRHPDTWRYLPHLPVEWLAIAIPVAAWLRARASAPVRGSGHIGLPTLASFAALTAAASIETYLVPVK